MRAPRRAESSTAPFPGWRADKASRIMLAMREWMEYAAAWMGLKTLGLLPRPAARVVGATFAAAAYRVRTPLRRAAMFNLRLAFPEWDRCCSASARFAE